MPHRPNGTNRPLAFTGGLMLAILAATLVGLLVDHRVISGSPAWIKPAKFAISIAVYCFTFEWLLSFITGWPRLTRLAANVTAICMVVEMIAIGMQAARGTTSHFNVSTPFDKMAWIVMGTFITIAFGAALLLAVILTIQKVPDRAFALSLRLGILLSLVGMAVAFLMTVPSKQQMSAMVDHEGLGISGAHSVGIADGGPGLPFLGWSTVAGDLRVPHFVGIHALQVLPFLGWLLMRKKGGIEKLGNGRRRALVWIAGVAYLGLVLLLVWQAERGESIVRASAATLIGATGLLSVTLISVGLVVLSGLVRNRIELAKLPR